MTDPQQNEWGDWFPYTAALVYVAALALFVGIIIGAAGATCVVLAAVGILT